MKDKVKDKKTVTVKVGTGYLFDVSDSGQLTLETNNWDGLVEEVAILSENYNIAVVS